MTKKSEFKKGSLSDLATELGINYQVLVLKGQLVETIKQVCEQKNIGTRALARMVPGLYADRVSKIFNGQVGHMTIDKLVEILDVLNYKVEVKTKKSA